MYNPEVVSLVVKVYNPEVVSLVVKVYNPEVVSLVVKVYNCVVLGCSSRGLQSTAFINRLYFSYNEMGDVTSRFAIGLR